LNGFISAWTISIDGRIALFGSSATAAVHVGKIFFSSAASASANGSTSSFTIEPLLFRLTAQPSIVSSTFDPGS
jgi:hypothetical protein